MKAQSKNGFTAIEVLIVIAIAGIVLLIVFLAIPQAQAAVRNEHRRRDVQRFLAALLDYRTNNRGGIPGSNLPNVGSRSKLMKPIVEDKVLPLVAEAGAPDASETAACSAAGPRPDFDSSLAGFDDPLLGRCYFVSYGDSVGELGKIDWIVGVKCLGETWLPLSESRTNSEGDIAATIALEGGAYHCVDNVFESN